MSSPFEYMDKTLSKLTLNKIVKEIKHIDEDACIQISFTDNSNIVIDGMPDKVARSGAIPIIHFYASDGNPIDYFTNS